MLGWHSLVSVVMRTRWTVSRCSCHMPEEGGWHIPLCPLMSRVALSDCSVDITVWSITKWPPESEVEAVSESARRGDSNTIFLRLADVHCRLVRDTDASST